jgi:Copper transport outer membrane protein, MctB
VFDLRYHVASLAAVFVALVIGIFVGVGLSGRGFVNDAERANLQARIDELRAERDTAVEQASSADVRGEALDSFAGTAYPELVEGRLDGKSVGVVFVGSVDQGIAGTVRRTVADAGGRVALMRALRVPLDTESIDETLGADEDLQRFSGPERREQLGREVARELVGGGPTPILRRLSATLVEEQSGISPVQLDAIVVARSARPQQGETQDFLAGLYGGLASTPIPSVGVDVHGTKRSPLPIFRRRGLSTVEAIDEATGRVALVFLLGGARAGSYGMGPDAIDGVLPDAPPAPTPTDE